MGQDARPHQSAGGLQNLGEYEWVKAYIKVRRKWLATNKRADLRATVYRMDALQRLMDQGYWGLELPLVVRGVEISIDALSATPRGSYDGPQPGTRPLALQSPLLRGLDVRMVQLGLSDNGTDIKADGVFGQVSMKCIKNYQAEKGLPVTGVVDISLIAQLVS